MVRLIFTRACREPIGETAAKKFPDHYERMIPRVAMPNSTDSCAIALSSPKTAALCFDRIWTTSDAPEDIRIFGGSPAEVSILVIPSVAARIVLSTEADTGDEYVTWQKVVQQLFNELMAEINPPQGEIKHLQLANLCDYKLTASVTTGMCSRAAD